MKRDGSVRKGWRKLERGWNELERDWVEIERDIREAKGYSDRVDDEVCLIKC